MFPSLARRFACCQSCSVSLRLLWAYGFDSAARRASEKSKVGEVNLEVSLSPIYLRLIIIKEKSVLFFLFQLLNAKNP